jgi:hypothetical protein
LFKGHLKEGQLASSMGTDRSFDGIVAFDPSSGAKRCSSSLHPQVRNAQEDVLSVTAASAQSCGDNIVGERVLICGLVNSPQFNGQWGHVESYDAEMERYVVRVFLAETGNEVLAKLRPSSILIPLGG